MPLDDEATLLGALRRSTERLGRLPFPALATVLVEAHLWIVARSATLSLPIGCIRTFFPAQTPFGDRG
jgi:hypothetical protein